ncbi:hypothetical protein [Nocardioides abyssi]|uniref:DUF305 domain-containing protein n=1 Tax=Nocardioides abyssi TaxID=3058370 RepID=A0ABT8EZB4_9ACTN|nr:hypothetical protein [Nocardioides abyssi]MDN4163502.1 hypothetical protein [Nocardioides abyssi]
MSPSTPVPAGTSTSISNDADHRYLQDARAALRRAIPLTDSVLRGPADPETRALASDALGEQTAQLAAIVSWLDEHPLPGTPGPAALGGGSESGSGSGSGTDARAGTALTFTDRLAAESRAAIDAARAEMVSGLSRRARAIAEESVRFHCRRIAALEPTGTTSAPGPEVVAHSRG